MGDQNGALTLYCRALEARARSLGEEHPDTLSSESELGVLLLESGDLEGALPLCRRALEARERTLGKDHLDTLSSVATLALLAKKSGDLSSAEALYRRAVKGRAREMGPSGQKQQTDAPCSLSRALVLNATGPCRRTVCMVRTIRAAQRRGGRIKGVGGGGLMSVFPRRPDAPRHPARGHLSVQPPQSAGRLRGRDVGPRQRPPHLR